MTPVVGSDGLLRVWDMWCSNIACIQQNTRGAVAQSEEDSRLHNIAHDDEGLSHRGFPTTHEKLSQRHRLKYFTSCVTGRLVCQTFVVFCVHAATSSPHPNH